MKCTRGATCGAFLAPTLLQHFWACCRTQPGPSQQNLDLRFGSGCATDFLLDAGPPHYIRGVLHGSCRRSNFVGRVALVYPSHEWLAILLGVVTL